VNISARVLKEIIWNKNEKATIIPKKNISKSIEEERKRHEKMLQKDTENLCKVREYKKNNIIYI
jgi:hypothetical protein